MPALVTRRAPGAPALAPRAVRGIAEAMLAAMELEQAELSVLLTDDRAMHALNLRHRGKDRPTDVLAFPQGDELLGDVVISLDTAARQAAQRKRPLLDEVRFLLAHGLLHLVGFDHDTREKKKKMDAMTRRLVRAAASHQDASRSARRR